MGAAQLDLLSVGRLHSRVTSLLAHRVIDSDRNGEIVTFPKEADLCLELGVSRTSLREAMKVLADKGMVEMKPKAGTRSKPRAEWRLLDPDILSWQAEVGADAQFLRDLCEVRLAIEPTAAGFAAVRATEEELARIEQCLEERRKLGVGARVGAVVGCRGQAIPEHDVEARDHDRERAGDRQDHGEKEPLPQPARPLHSME